MSILNPKNIRAAKVSAAIIAVPVLLLAYASGPDPRNTGAPGDRTCAQAGCHVGTNVNAGPGNVAISFPGGLTYVPGERQTLTVTVTDAQMRVFGFQASARLESNLTAGQAGTFSSTDGNTQVLCDDGGVRAASGCRAGFNVEFIEHVLASSRNTFTFAWTPPATASGNIRIYVAGNAANGNGQNTGDRIYTASYTLTPGGGTTPPPVLPTISAGGVADAFNFSAGIGPASWTAIVGKDLATQTKSWDAAIVDRRLPTTLEGVSVTVNSKPATIFFVSPTQINVLTPNDIGTGDMAVVVKNATGESAPFSVRAAAFKPAFYTPFADSGRLYVTAVALDGTIVGKVGNDSRARRAVKPGEVILVFGSGFGPTNPVSPTDQIVSGAPAITTPVRIRFGDTVATFAGTGNLVAAGLYQFNVTVPSTLPDGDVPIIAEIGGITSAANAYISVQQ